MKILKGPVRLTLVFMLICGIIYPAAMTVLGNTFFKDKAMGSLIRNEKGEVTASSLVGQKNDDPKYLHGRPSSVDYNVYSQAEKDEGKYKGPASGGFNEAAGSPELKERIIATVEKVVSENGVSKEDIPIDLITGSGSGLDPNISLEAALIQLERISMNTGIGKEELRNMVNNSTKGRFLGIFGEETVNVTEFNIELYGRLKKN